MKVFLRLFVRDVRDGFYEIAGLLLAFFMLQLVFFAVLRVRFDILCGSPLVSFGDCLMWFLAGIQVYVFDPADPLKIPAQWLLTLLFVAFASVLYPSRSLSRMGVYLILASGDRWRWWLSKCAWVLLCVVAFFFVGIAAAAFFVLLTGGEFAGASAQTLVAAGVGEAIPNASSWPLGVVAPVLVGEAFLIVSLCHAQLLVAFSSRPIAGLVLFGAVLFLSAFVFTPFLPGSFLMAARNEAFVYGGLNLWQGCAFSAVLSVLSVVVGGILFRRKDLIGERSEK